VQAKQEVSLLNFYFTYGRYFFLLFLSYSFLIITLGNPDSLGVVELLLGFVFPAIPVWAGFYFFPLIARDAKLLHIKYITVSAPLLIMLAEIYPILILSLYGTHGPLGLLAAFGAGAVMFFILFGSVILLSFFSKPSSQTNS